MTTNVETAARRGAILVVEDRDDVRQGLSQLLELHGFLVADSRSGADALAQLTTDPDSYALVLLDLMLPGAVSGRDFRMRQLSEPALAVPTIIVTATDVNRDERVGLNPDGWLDKPFRFDDLLTLVKRCVVPEDSAFQLNSQ